MDNERPKLPNLILGDAEQDLMSLVDLQRFLAEELADSVDITTDFSKSFTPLTTGLGFHATSKPSAPAEPLQRFPAELPRVLQQHIPEPMPAPSAVDELLEQTVVPTPQAAPAPKSQQPIRRFVDESVMERDFDADSQSSVTSFRVKEQRLRKALGEESAALPELDTARMQSTPPPLPQAGVLRRAMAGILDQVFVLVLSVLSVVVVTNLVSSDSSLMSGRMFKELGRPEIFKYLLAGYMGVWLTYLTLSVGILEATFGMWIWGLRIQYGNEQRFVKKFARVGLTLLCQVTIVPALLLIYQRDGKNLIDSLSGSQVTRSQA